MSALSLWSSMKLSTLLDILAGLSVALPMDASVTERQNQSFYELATGGIPIVIHFTSPLLTNILCIIKARRVTVS